MLQEKGSPSHSIVTPSLNMVEYLKLCHQSIVDQEGASFEHIVADGGSEDGTVQWLDERADVYSFSGRDAGMYDALNKGLKRARGEILSYLNSDEQYLPGTLAFVKDTFDQNPDIDILFGDVLLVDKDGSLLSFRKGYRPSSIYISVSHLYLLTCAMFFRRRVIDDGYTFNESLRVAGDADLVVRLLKAGYKAVHVRKYLAVFTVTGSNMSAGTNAYRERAMLSNSLPFHVRFLRVPINAVRLLEKFMSGAYFENLPIEYSIYTRDSATIRKNFLGTASFRWPKQ